MGHSLSRADAKSNYIGRSFLKKNRNRKVFEMFGVEQTGKGALLYGNERKVRL